MSRWLTSGESIRTYAQKTPDKEAVADLYRSLTYREWNERCNRLANALLDLGLKKGDRIAFIAFNCIEWMEVYGALAKNGLICVPIMFRLAPVEYQYILDNSEAKAFIVASEFIDGAESIRPELPGIKHWIHLGQGETPEGYIDFEGLMSQGSPEEPPVTVTPEDVWVIMYTSGTTGKPKGVVRNHESHIGFNITNAMAMAYDRNDRFLMVMPMCHINSIFYGFTATYIGGTTVVYNMASFDPEHLLKTLQDFKITFVSLVPTHYIMIQALPDEVKGKYDVSNIKKLLCSSAPARKDTKLWILDFFKGTELYEAYGSTEGGLKTLLYPEQQFEKLGSIGKEIPGTDMIKLINDEGKPCAVGEVGEIYTKTAAVFSHYWKNPEQTKAAFLGEWFSAGDMGYIDEDGYYYLVDRKKNMIITGGENVFPTEVENVLGGHPSVRDVAVVGVPDEKWGEMVTAVVVLHNEYKSSEELAQELRDFTKGKLAGFKRPKRIEFIPDEEMPRTGTGKVLHRELRTRFGHWADK